MLKTDQWQVGVFLIWKALLVDGWVKIESGRWEGRGRSASGFKTISRLLREIQKKVKTEILAPTEGKYIQTK